MFFNMLFFIKNNLKKGFIMKKITVSGFKMEKDDHKEIEMAAKRIGVSIPLYTKMKSLAAAKEENLAHLNKIKGVVK